MTSAKRAFALYTPRENGKRTIEESISEIQREMDTRKRLFDRWVADGKMSWVDAHDRMERIMSALRWMIQYSNELDQAAREATSMISTPNSTLPESELDTVPEAQAA